MPRHMMVSQQADDAVQEAMLGLIQASRSYDPARVEGKFGAYAQHRIRGQFQDFLRRSPLVGNIRSDKVRTLRQIQPPEKKRDGAEFGEAIQNSPDTRDSSRPDRSARFDSLIDALRVKCGARAAQIVELWAEGWTYREIGHMHQIKEARVFQVIQKAIRDAREIFCETRS